MRTNRELSRALIGLAAAGAILTVIGLAAPRAYAQKAGGVVMAPSATEQDITNIDTQRGALDRFLDSHPEIAREVVDHPATMNDANFLHDHPEMQAFLESHPLVKADPRAFISPRAWKQDYHSTDLQDALGDIVPGVVMICLFLVTLGVFRVVLENRRWNRAFKMHEEVHTKLIEKFASGQDFGAYIQSEAGRRLLEWTPPALDTAGHGLPTALSRILWSLQAGLVLLLMGFGLLMIRGQMAATDAPPLLVTGTLGLTLGAGFILSAISSYALSRHLGLMVTVTPGADATGKH